MSALPKQWEAGNTQRVIKLEMSEQGMCKNLEANE